MKNSEQQKGSKSGNGSIFPRAGIQEAVFKQGEEFSAPGRISVGEEKNKTAAAQRMKSLE